MRKSIKSLFLVAVIFMSCLSYARSVEAVNWISRNEYATWEWDADSVFSRNDGSICVVVKGNNAAQGQTYIFDAIIQNHRETAALVYGRVYNNRGELVFEKAMNNVVIFSEVNNGRMYYDIMHHCDKYKL